MTLRQHCAASGESISEVIGGRSIRVALEAHLAATEANMSALLWALGADYFGRHAGSANLPERFADLPSDLADASITEAAERMRIGRLLSIDSDFDVYRDHAGRPLQNVLIR